MDNKFLSFLHEDGFWRMLHALLRDTLTLSLFAFAGLMSIEGLMPGFVTGHLNLAKVLFIIALLMFAFIAIGSKRSIPVSKGNVPKWFIIGLITWSSLMILNSLIKFPFYAIVIIFLFTVSIGKLLYDELLKTN